jgi:hypothetical protein
MSHAPSTDKIPSGNPVLSQISPEASPPKPGRLLTPEAERALAEAAERRALQAEREKQLASNRELAGRGGKDPVRYNDWEIKGLASDF